MNDKLRQSDLEELFEKLIDNISKGWDDDIKVDKLQKLFTGSALRKVLKSSISDAFKTMQDAVGVAYVREHANVQWEDCELAIKLRKEGVEMTVLKTDDHWINE